MDANIAILPGDGVGVEVIAEARKTLNAVATRFGHTFAQSEALVGGAAIAETGEPLPEATLTLCIESDAVLFGAVGDPRYDDPEAEVRPEQAIMLLRKHMGLFANLRPVWVHPALTKISPLRPELVQGADLVVVRELWRGDNRVGAVGPLVGDRHDFVVLPCRVGKRVCEKEKLRLEQAGREAWFGRIKAHFDRAGVRLRKEIEP